MRRYKKSSEVASQQSQVVYILKTYYFCLAFGFTAKVFLVNNLLNSLQNHHLGKLRAFSPLTHMNYL